MENTDTLAGEFVDHCIRLAGRPADLWSGGDRKIIRKQRLTFDCWDDSLQASDLGYSAAKLKQLERNYLHEESRQAAVKLWNDRLSKQKFGSVSFSTYNHLIKGGATVDDVLANKSKHGSVVGPCMQSVVLTWLSSHRAAIDVTFRSAELFKKLPADLVFLRDVLLQPFDMRGMLLSVTCHCINVTCHPRDWVLILPMLEDPLDTMRDLKRRDPKFHRHLVKWTAEYLCPEFGSSIANYATGQRVKRHATGSIKGQALRDLQQYLRANLH